MTDSINKKLHANDRMLDSINAKLDDFSSAIKNQLSFNKMLETQLAQLAAAIPSFEKIEYQENLEQPWNLLILFLLVIMAMN
jgi:hypothetical protein